MSFRMGWRHLLVAAAVGILLAASSDGSGANVADVPDDKDTTLETTVANPEELAQQERLDSHVDPLLRSGLLEAADNFGGSAADYEDNAYDMWWRGSVPGNVQSVLDGFGDVKVRLHEAKYTAREIEAAATRVSKYSSEQFVVVTATIENVERPTPVHGIEVEVTERGDVPDAVIVAELTEAAGLPVALDASLHSVPALWTR